MNNEKLIQIVREYRFLYDISDKKYGDGHKKELAWDEIGLKLKKNGQDCKKAWALLRDAFRRSVRKRPCDERGQTSVPEKRWKYEEEMSFLLPFMKRRPPKPACRANDDADEPSPEGSQESETAPSLSNDEAPKMQSNKQSIQVDVDQFMAGITATVRSFPPRFRAFAKSKIFEIVSQMEMEILTRLPASASAAGSPGSGTSCEDCATTQEFCQVYLAPDSEDIKQEP